MQGEYATDRITTLGIHEGVIRFYHLKAESVRDSYMREADKHTRNNNTSDIMVRTGGTRSRPGKDAIWMSRAKIRRYMR